MKSSKKGRLIAAAIAVIVALVSYYAKSDYNEITGETQQVAMTETQEVALGQQAAPRLITEYGGLHPDQKAAALVKTVGQRLVQQSMAKDSPYEFDFHLLNDDQAINAFALPGGQLFITSALYSRLESEDQLAGVLGHEIGHVLARHSAQQAAQQELMEGINGAAVMATYDPSNPATTQTAQVAKMIGNMISMKYGRDDELESDELGVRIMVEAGYDPTGLIGVMEILAAAMGGERQSEFTSTHPSPENRIEKIQEAIAKYQ